MKLLTNIFFTSLLSLLLLSNISYAQPNVQVLNYSHGKYVGEALNGKANGQGTYTSKSGVIYSGKFVNDTFNGTGTMIWPNGDKFVGNWQNDAGINGLMTFASGSTTSGVVKNAVFYPEANITKSPQTLPPTQSTAPVANVDKSYQPVTYISNGIKRNACFDGLSFIMTAYSLKEVGNADGIALTKGWLTKEEFIKTNVRKFLRLGGINKIEYESVLIPLTVDYYAAKLNGNEGQWAKSQIDLFAKCSTEMKRRE